MNRNIKNILSEKLIRSKLEKTEVYKYVNKSLTQNNNISNNIKIYSIFLEGALNNCQGRTCGPQSSAWESLN